MKITEVNRDILHIPTLPDVNMHLDLDNPPATGPTIKTREIVLRPGVFRGKQVMRAYDRETDTLYIRHKP